MASLRNKRLLITIGLVVAVAVLVLPTLVAYRYTAPEQRGEFLRRPWSGWSFVAAALTVPADSVLKTSGMALRRSEWRFRGTAVDPQEVQLIFTEQDVPYTFSHTIGGRTIATTVTPSYRFLWQVKGSLTTRPDSSWIVVAVLDYETGNVLYDVRNDLLPDDPSPSPTPTPSSPSVE